MEQSAKNLIDELSRTSMAEIENMEVSSEQVVALERILRYYIEQILESKLKSSDVMKQLRK